MIVLTCVEMRHAHVHAHGHGHQGHGHDHAAQGHGHSHGLVDRSITSSREGLRVVGVSLVVLLVTALVQAVIFVSTASVALLADLIHNAGDALTAVPLVGFVGNEIAARVRLHGGKRLSSPALIADGHHARVDGFVSLAVVASAAVVALGFPLGDPIIGLVITIVILRITWQSIQTIKADPGKPMA